MVPQLKLDIYRCIAEHLKSVCGTELDIYRCVAEQSNPEIASRSIETRREIKECQDALHNMMMVSKEMYELISPMSHMECSIGNMSPLVVGVQVNSIMIDNIRTLLVYSGKHEDAPSDADLLGRGFWPTVNRGQERIIPFAAVKEMELCAMLGNSIKQSMNKGIDVFPKLRKVALGVMGESLWSSRRAKAVEEVMTGPYRLDRSRSLPRMLLALPSVEHYCVSAKHGPLALSARIFKSPAALRIFSVHIGLNPSIASSMRGIGPIVVGAINRQYFPSPFVVNDDDTKFWSTRPDARAYLLDTLVKAFASRRLVYLTPNTEEQSCANINTVNLDDTVIELYDYIRLVAPTSIHDSLDSVDGLYSKRACRPARSLVDIQKELDKALPRRWRGRVLLKNREEGPPCTACGEDIMESWNSIMSG